MIVDAWGARNSMALGGMSNTIMLSLYWIIATEHVKLHDVDLLVLVLSVLGVLIFVGCALVTGSVFKVIVESCGGGTKGKAVGCAKGYVGVGSGVYVCLFGALFGTSGGGTAVGPAASALSFIKGTGSSVSSGLFPMSSIALASNSTSDGVPQNPEVSSLNFLLMAAVLSFLAAVLPALILLPKQKKSATLSSSISVYQNRRDGTRDIHFRVVYAGLLLLGLWVVGVGLSELHENDEGEETNNSNNDSGNGGGTNGEASGVDPSILNKTLMLLLERDFVTDHHDVEVSDLRHTTSTYYARKLWNVTRRLSSSSSPERHWGSVFFLLFLWWGPALSLLVIPPRKEGCAVGDESIVYSPENNNEYSYGYDEDDIDDGNNDVVNGISNNNGSGENNDDREDEEEITFLQDDLPAVSSRLSSFATTAKNDERVADGGGNQHLDPAAERNFTLTQMLQTCPAWLMIWTCVILVGGGTVMTNNIGQMTEALGFDPAMISASLALFSAAQGASRVCTGIASELALKWHLPWYFGCFSSGGGGTAGGVPRPAFLVLASLVSAASHFILAVSTTEEAFAFGVTLSGVAFGMVWPMMVLITGEVFGNRHVGANYMFYDGFSSAAGTLLLSKFVAQEVYDEHIVENHGDPGAATTDFMCLGAGCFANSHVIVSLLSLTCVVSSIGLIRTTRHVYNN